MRFFHLSCLALALMLVCWQPASAISQEEALAQIQEEEEEEEEFEGHGVFTDEELASMDNEGVETHEFQAEVTRLMDIIINALYGNREVFLRELMSNSADALDKLRFMATTNPEVLGETPELKIEIKTDEKAKTLTVCDTGLGMTKEDLVKNLGVVAKSGTTEFVEAALSGGSDALSLIGQFGVGFYSVYLIGDRVTVVSKNNDDDQYVWQSNADRSFSVAKDPRGNTLGRGTCVTIHVKEDAKEFLQVKTLRGIVEKYSQFLNFPIWIEVTNTVSVEVPLTEEELEAQNAEEDEEEDLTVDFDEDGEDIGDDEEAFEEEEKPTTKTVREDKKEWERVNPVKAMWTRSPKEISNEEYNEFYRSFY